MSQELDFLPVRVTRLERVIRTLHETILAPIEDRLNAHSARIAALEARIAPAAPEPPA